MRSSALYSYLKTISRIEDDNDLNDRIFASTVAFKTGNAARVQGGISWHQNTFPPCA
jgi:hypothetical protein